MKYTAITIENFRGISHLELADLKDFNLIVGRNNCGKTSVLEAMFLLSVMANPQLIVNINNSRGITTSIEDDFSSMFRNLGIDTAIRLKGRIDTESTDRMLTITPSYGFYKTASSNAVTEHIELLPVTSNVPSAEGINFDFTTQKNEKFHGEFHVKEGKIRFPENYKENLLCTYLSPYNVNNINNAEQMDDLIINKKFSSIISVLKTIDPSIRDISMGRKTMYVDIGAERLVPINVMGDGMRKILALLASVAASKDGILLIDEIENGLHYSSLSVLWKAIFAACKEYNVQIIATTHSYECVENFSKMYGNIEKDDDNIRLFRIGKEGEKHKVYPYSAEVLSAGIEKEFEVR